MFFDRFYREVVGLQGDDIMDILDASFPWVSETFVGPFGLLAYQADELRQGSRTTSGRGSGTPPSTSCGSRACWPCRS